MKKRIFSANRGEGKTTWLIDRAADSSANGNEVYYLGSKNCFMNFKHKCLEAGVVGVHYMKESIPSGSFDVFTDEFMDAFKNIDTNDLEFAEKYADNWYITMSKEDFE